MKKNLWWALCILIVILTCVLDTVLVIRFSNNIYFVPISIFIFGCCLFIISCIYNYKIEKIEVQNKNIFENCEEENQYNDYIKIVEETLKDFMNDLLEENASAFIVISTNSKRNYLKSFKENTDWVIKNRINGKPDSFIMASCLMFAIIENPLLLCRQKDLECANTVVYAFNCKIALEIALKIISEPITYYEDENGKWIPKKHPKVNITLPEGIIEKSPLESRIIKAIMDDFQTNENYYIMQFSNLLHLIYLNCNT